MKRSIMISLALGALAGVAVALVERHRDRARPTRCCESDPPAGCGYDDEGRPVESYEATYHCYPDAGISDEEWRRLHVLRGEVQP